MKKIVSLEDILNFFLIKKIFIKSIDYQNIVPLEDIFNFYTQRHLGKNKKYLTLILSFANIQKVCHLLHNYCAWWQTCNIYQVNKRTLYASVPSLSFFFLYIMVKIWPNTHLTMTCLKIHFVFFPHQFMWLICFLQSMKRIYIAYYIFITNAYLSIVIIK